MKKKSAAVVVVALGVLPFYACSNSEQAAYMERPSIEANALEAEQAEQEFAELAAKEAAGEDTHVQGKAEKKALTKSEKKSAKTETSVAKHDAPKAEKKKPAHDPGHKAETVKAVAKVQKQEAPKHEAPKHEAPTKAVAAHAVESNVTRKPASVHQTGATSSVWVVQLGAFRVKENAEKLTAKLKTNGYPVLMRAMNHSKNGELFVVSLEPTPNKSEAQKWQQELKTKSFDTNLVFRKD